MNINRIVVDARLEGTTTLDISLRLRRWPSGPQTLKGPYPRDANTPYNRVRAQGREAGLVIESSGVDDEWRLGTIRLDISEGPRR